MGTSLLPRGRSPIWPAAARLIQLLPGSARPREDRAWMRSGAWGVLALACLGGIAGCQMDRNEGMLMAAGSYGDIALVLSDDDLRPLAQDFAGILNTPVTFVIKDESPYKIDIWGPAKWKLCRGYRNIIFLVRLGDGGPVEKEVKKHITEAFARQVQNGEPGLAQVHDPYARYQYAVMALANDRNLLASMLHKRVDELRRNLEKDIRVRYRLRWQHEGWQSGVSEQLWQSYQFTLKLPPEYHENQAEPNAYPALEFMRTQPSRGLTIAWRKSSQPGVDVLNEDLLLAWRRELGVAMHHEELVDVSLDWSEADFVGRVCPKLTGAWAATDFEGGGPFWSFFLADPEGGRIFCIDLLAYAPGQDSKMGYFRELQALAETFSLVSPSS